MVKTGLTINDSIREHYNEVHLGKLKGFKFAIKGSTCVLDEASFLEKDHETPFSSLVTNGLEDGEPCFVVVNVCFRDTERKFIQKTMLFAWCSDNANVKQRMTMASSFGAVRGALGVLEGCFVEIHSQEEQVIDSIFGKIIGNRAKPATFENRMVSFDNDTNTYAFADN